MHLFPANVGTSVDLSSDIILQADSYMSTKRIVACPISQDIRVDPFLPQSHQT